MVKPATKCDKCGDDENTYFETSSKGEYYQGDNQINDGCEADLCRKCIVALAVWLHKKPTAKELEEGEKWRQDNVWVSHGTATD